MSQTSSNTPSSLKIILAFATVYIVWGSTYFFIQRALEGFPPFFLGAIRFLIAGLLLLGWAVVTRAPVWDWKNIKHAAVSGILMLTFGNGIVIWAEQYLSSAVVAIMVSASPLWFVILDKRKWAFNFTSKATIAGLIIGFAGVILLFSERIAGAFSAGGNHMELGVLALLMFGAIAWAAGSLYSKYNSSEASATVNISWQMLFAGLAFVPASLAFGEPSNIAWRDISADAWLSLAYLIFMGSIAGFSAYVWLLHVRPATQVSTYAYVNPVVAVLLGFFLAGENISLLQILGLAIILVSVLLINLPHYRKKATESASRLDAKRPAQPEPAFDES